MKLAQHTAACCATLLAAALFTTGCTTVGAEQNELRDRSVQAQASSIDSMNGDDHVRVEQSDSHENVVFYSMREVRNLYDLHQFMDHIHRKEPDQIEIVSLSKEGDRIHRHLTYDGDSIQMTTTLTQSSVLTAEEDEEAIVKTEVFDRILIEDRYSDHYAGTFREYYAVHDEEERKVMIVQITPDLLESTLSHHVRIVDITTDLQHDGNWYIIPTGVQKFTIEVKAEFAETVLFWLVPTGTESWNERELIGYDIDAQDGWSITYEIGDRFLHDRIVVQAIGSETVDSSTVSVHSLSDD